MEKPPIIILICSFLLCFGIALPVYSQDNNAAKKVLVVHSYHSDYEWVSTISRGIKRVFERAENVRVEIFYMDTKRKTSQEWKEESGKKAREVISQWNPDVVITADDNAQEYVGKFYADKKRPQIVFCGVNSKAQKYGYPASNITGILERPHIKDTVDLLGQVVSSVKKIAVISDNSPTSQGAIEYIKTQAQTLDKKVVAYDTPVTFAQWKSRIVAYQQQADAILVYMYHTVKREGQKESMTPKEVMKWTITNCSIPVVGFFTFTIDDGALLGVVESGLEHGREAAIVAMDLLRGKSIQQYPVKTAKKGLVMLNILTADKMGISINEELKERIDIMAGE